MEDKLEQVADLIAASKHLVIFTGAGVSTESGLSDYRGPEGVWTLREKGLKPKLPKVPWHMVESIFPLLSSTFPSFSKVVL